MPHMTQTLPTGEKIGLEMLPMGTTWSNLSEEVNDLDKNLGHTSSLCRVLATHIDNITSNMI